MKFKAHIKLTDAQSEDAVRHCLEDTEYHNMEFTLKDLAEHLVMVYETRTFPRDLREHLIPWLLAGNQPEIVECDPENIGRSLFTYLIGRKTVDRMFSGTEPKENQDE